MLPETMKCPHCGEELELDTNERTSEKVTCPTCGKLVHSPSSHPREEEVFETRYNSLRGYSTIVKTAAVVVGIAYFLLFVIAGIEIPQYSTWFIVAGAVMAVLIVVPYLFLSEAIKAFADMADNSHEMVMLLQTLVRKREE